MQTGEAMQPLSPDTPLEVERVWLEGIRAKGPYFQLQRMLEMANLCRQAARSAVQRAHPDASQPERDRILLRELYGDEEMARKVVEMRRERGFYDRQP
jgi:hypothetical protein